MQLLELKSVLFFSLSGATVSPEAATEVKDRVANSDISWGCEHQMTLVPVEYLFNELSCEEFFKPAMFSKAGLHFDNLYIHLES